MGREWKSEFGGKKWMWVAGGVVQKSEEGNLRKSCKDGQNMLYYWGINSAAEQ